MKDLYSWIANLCRKLREKGVKISISEEIDAALSLTHINLKDYEQVLYALKVTLIKYPGTHGLLEKIVKSMIKDSDKRGDYEVGHEVTLPRLTRKLTLPKTTSTSLPFTPKHPYGLFIYSPNEVRFRREFSDKIHVKVRDVKRALRSISKILALMPGRRMMPSMSGYIDFKRTFRISLSTNADIVKIARSLRKLSKARLVFLFDVSGSMEEYSRWMFGLMYAIGRACSSEIFVFSTSLIRVTDIVKGCDTKSFPERISNEVDIWGSGTRIGKCLDEFVNNYRGILNKKTALVIISDGWDTGEISRLVNCMKKIKGSSGKVIWLNPHVDKPGFSPMTLGMRAVIPYLDILTTPRILENSRLATRKIRQVMSSPKLKA